MRAEIRQALEDTYAIGIESWRPGPRQFVAETFVLADRAGRHYFCKVVDKPLVIPEILAALPVLEEMHECGCTRISPPLRGPGGLYARVRAAIVVAYQYIPAPQSQEYDMWTFGRLLAEIHALTPRLTRPAPREEYRFADWPALERFLAEARGRGEIALATREVLARHERAIRARHERLLELGQCVRGRAEHVITHGDAPGNVLVKAPRDLYLIDWDELELAAPERDLWIVDHVEGFLDGYRSLGSYEIDPELRSFYILKYHLRSLAHYLAEVVGEHDHGDEHRRRHLSQLERSLERGWMLPKLDEIEV